MAISPPTIDLRRLRYFVTVAETSSFTQAADRLGMAQPPLSQQIMALEKQLGQRLFIRHARSVELTDAGRALFEEAEPLLTRAAEIPDRLRRAAAGRTGTLCLGFTPALAHHSLLPRLLRLFRSEAPEIDLQFRERDTEPLCHDVAAGRIQIALIRPPAPAHEGLRIDELAEEPLVVAVPETHRLAQRQSVSLSELADEAFVMFERTLAPALYDDILTSCLRSGFSIRVVHHAPQKVSAMMLVAGGAGITLVPSSLAGVQPDALRMIPLQGPQPIARIALAMRVDEQSVLPVRFRTFALEHVDRD